MAARGASGLVGPLSIRFAHASFAERKIRLDEADALFLIERKEEVRLGPRRARGRAASPLSRHQWKDASATLWRVEASSVRGCYVAL